MNIKKGFLVLGVLLAALGAWGGRMAWRAHRELVTLDVHNAPLAEVLRSIEYQTWKKIRAERTLDARITLRVKDKPLADVLDAISEQAGARWSTVYAVYGSSESLSHLEAALQSGGQLKPAGWSQVAPKTVSENPLDFDPDSPPDLPPPGLEGPGPGKEARVAVMFTRTPDGQVSVRTEGKTMTETWSREELVMESSLEAKLGHDRPAKATSGSAAEAARRLHAKWSSRLVLRKSILGIGLGGGPAPLGKGGDPLRRGPNERFARLTAQQRVLQARQRHPIAQTNELEIKP